MQIIKKRTQINNGKRTIVKLPNDWLIQLGIDISIDSMDKLELLFDEKLKTITIKKEC